VTAVPTRKALTLTQSLKAFQLKLWDESQQKMASPLAKVETQARQIRAMRILMSKPRHAALGASIALLNMG